MTAPPSTFVDVIRRAASRVGDERGIRFYRTPRESERIGYAELDRRAQAGAAALTARGHRPGDAVVLAFQPGLDVIEAIASAFYAGLTVVPVPVVATRDTRAAAQRIASIVSASGSRLVLGDDVSLEMLGDRVEGDALTIAALTQHAVAPWSPPGIDAASVAVLQYTSGSTGTPRGVIVTHGNLLANQTSMTAAAGTHDGSVLVGWLPHFHDMGLIGQLMHPIYAAIDSVLTSPSQFLRRPLFWLRLITEHRATISVAPDFAYELCTRLVTAEQLTDLDLSSLETLVTGAEPVRATTVRAFTERFAAADFAPTAFVPAYGMAETTLLVTAKAAGQPVRVERLDAAQLETGHARPAETGARSVDVVSCGVPTPGHTIAIVDPDLGLRVDASAIGEIWVSGPSVTAGYRGDPAASAATFGARLPDDDRPYLRTGDLGALVDGELVIVGRRKDLIIVRGRNISPLDLEAVATRRTGAGTVAAAFELPGQTPTVGLIAEIDPAQHRDTDLDEFIERLRDDLVDEFSLPGLAVAVIRRGALPRTTSGKVQRSRARHLIERGELAPLSSRGFAPTEPEEER